MFTFDAARGLQVSPFDRLERGYRTHDGRTVDSAGAFFVNELERLDPTLHMPLAMVSWSRDIDLREDVTIEDDAASYTNTTFAAPGGIHPTGKNWAGKDSTAIAGIAVDIAKTPQPLTLWAMELKYSIPELLSSIRLVRPIDQQKFEGLNLKHQMDIDEMVYTGDVFLGATGLLNRSGIAVTTATVGALGTTTWATKTPQEILADVNAVLANTWAASGYAVLPDRIGLPPAQYGMLVATMVSQAGNTSILKFLEDNNLVAMNGGKLSIVPMKWAIGMGVGGTPQVLGTVDRMIAYTKDSLRVRYPMTPIQKTPVQYQGIYYATYYYCKLGVVEFIYPSTFAYLDGI
jgi:hypothetical protein